MSVTGLLGAGFGILAGCGLLYIAAAIIFVRRFASRHVPRAAAAPSITLLKPLHGGEPNLFENLSSFCAQAYPGPVQVVFGVQRTGDPAIQVVEALRARFPRLPIDVVVDGRMHGSNRKVSNLINMEEAIRNEVVVLADSDMIVQPDYLVRLVDALSVDRVGAVTCLYHGVPSGNVWSRVGALGIDTQFLPSVAVGIGLGLAQPCFGSTIALRRSTLDEIGGFRSVANDLADDYLIGQAVRGLGRDVAVTSFTVGHACPETSLSELIRQELRWVRTIRQIDPAGHAGSLVAHPLVFALAALLLAPNLVTGALVCWAVALRVGLCLAVERAFGLKAHPYWLAPARDLLSFSVFVASFLSRAVNWRGHSYDVAPDGVLTPRDEALNPR